MYIWLYMYVSPSLGCISVQSGGNSIPYFGILDRPTYMYTHMCIYICMYILLWVFWFPIFSANLDSNWEHHCRSGGNLGYCSLPCYRAHAAGQCPARPEVEKPAKKPRNQEPRDHGGAFNARFFRPRGYLDRIVEDPRSRYPQWR